VKVSNSQGTYTWTGWGIPPARLGEAEMWTTLKFSTGIAFYALWVFGAGEALLRHQSEVVTETKQPIQVAPGATLKLSPLPGGLGAGLTVTF
jgi:hypothetical protein